MGPATRVVCRIINGNSCGSGSICGIRDRKSLILTNAHVASSRIGNVVRVEVESTGDTFRARVIEAAYSNRTMTDWAVLESLEPYDAVKPVPLAMRDPSGSHYTKGFPRCRPHNGTDIRTVDVNQNGLWLWEPDAIGGQSGSGVWSDNEVIQFGLLTWQYGQHGAGQTTSQIWRQSQRRNTVAGPMIPGLVPLDEHTYGGTDVELPEGYFAQMNVGDLPIWEGNVPDDDVPDDDDDDDGYDDVSAAVIIAHKETIAYHEKKIDEIQGNEPDPDCDVNNPDVDDTYGL